MPQVLAIDPSLGGCAVAVASTGRPEVLTYLFTSSPAQDSRGRVLRYRGIIQPIVAIARRQPDLDLIIIEGYAFGAQSAGANDRAEFGGMLRDALIDLAPVWEVSPTTLKMWVTGKGTASKAEMVSSLSRRWDRGFTSDDEADAFGLAVLGLQMLGFDAPNGTAAQRTQAFHLAAALRLGGGSMPRKKKKTKKGSV